MEFIDRDLINHLFWAMAERLFRLQLSAFLYGLGYVNYCTTCDRSNDIVDHEDGNVDDYGDGAG